MSIGFRGVRLPLTPVTRNFDGPAGTNLHSVQVSGFVNPSKGQVTVSSSIVQGDVRSPGALLLAHSLVQGEVHADSKIMVNHSTVQGNINGSDVFLDHVRTNGIVFATNLDLTDSLVMGAAMIGDAAYVRHSSLDSLHALSCGLFRGVIIREMLSVRSDQTDLVIEDSRVPFIEFGQASGITDPRIFFRGKTLVTGDVIFVGHPGTVFLESGARFTGNVRNGTVQRSGRSGT